MNTAQPPHELLERVSNINAHALPKALRLINGQLPTYNKIAALALLADRVVKAAEQLGKVMR